MMPQPAEQGFVTPQWQMILHPNLFQTPNTGNQSAPRTPTDHTSTQVPSCKKCHSCGQKGHFANLCPNPRSRPPLTSEATSSPPPTHNGSSTPTQAQQNYAGGRVNVIPGFYAKTEYSSYASPRIKCSTHTAKRVHRKPNVII
jgi:hypothetical protein